MAATFSTTLTVAVIWRTSSVRSARGPTRTDGPSEAQFASRLSAVRKILYLLFTEGYLSSHAETGIRRELCNEAIRLANILAEHPIGQTPETFALLALMHLHAARMPARQDGSGGLVLLEEQDRDLWDPEEIQVGLVWLARSAQGDVFSYAEGNIPAVAIHIGALPQTPPDVAELQLQFLNPRRVKERFDL